MKLTKERLMENAGLLKERELNPYSQMVGSFAANYVGFQVSISNGELLAGGSISGDFLVVGYGRFIDNPTGDFNASSKPSKEVLILQDMNGGNSGLQSMLCSAAELESKVKVKQ